MWSSERDALALEYRAVWKGLDARAWSKKAAELVRAAATQLVVERAVPQALALASELRRRLRTGARVPAETRDAILLTHAVASALDELQGEGAPSMERVGRALSLRMRWRRLAELCEGDASAWPGELVRRAAARATTEGTLKDLYAQAAAHWPA